MSDNKFSCISEYKKSQSKTRLTGYDIEENNQYYGKLWATVQFNKPSGNTIEPKKHVITCSRNYNDEDSFDKLLHPWMLFTNIEVGSIDGPRFNSQTSKWECKMVTNDENISKVSNTLRSKGWELDISIQ